MKRSTAIVLLCAIIAVLVGLLAQEPVTAFTSPVSPISPIESPPTPKDAQGGSIVYEDKQSPTWIMPEWRAIGAILYTLPFVEEDPMPTPAPQTEPPVTPPLTPAPVIHTDLTPAGSEWMLPDLWMGECPMWTDGTRITRVDCP